MRQDIVICSIILIVIGASLVGVGILVTTQTHEDTSTLTGLGLENIGEYVTAGGIIGLCIGLFLTGGTPQPRPPAQPQYPQPSYQQQYQPQQQPQYPQQPYQQPPQQR